MCDDGWQGQTPGCAAVHTRSRKVMMPGIKEPGPEGSLRQRSRKTLQDQQSTGKNEDIGVWFRDDGFRGVNVFLGHTLQQSITTVYS